MKDFGIIYLNDKCTTIDNKGNHYKKFKSVITNEEYNVKTKRKEQIQTYCVVNYSEKTILEYCDNINDDYESIITKLGLLNWSMKFNKNFSFKDIDLTPDRKFYNEQIISIDPIGCKDIDDAIHLTEDENLYKIYIHISDPSSYIPIDSDIDKEIQNRNSSLYINTVYHMLPEILSTDIISLIEKKERRAYTCIIKISKETYDIINYEFIKSNIIVEKNMSYEEFQLDLDKNTYYKKIYDIGYNLYKKLNLNEEYNSHKMIEAYMILCNMCAAEKCVIKRISSIRNSEYTILNQKHSQLNIYYTHFTSPIRRYIDIIVHRLIFNSEVYSIDKIKDIISGVNNKNRIIKRVYNIYNLINLLGNNKYIETTGKIIYVEDLNIKINVNDKILNINIDRRLVNNNIIDVNNYEDMIEIIQNNLNKIYKVNDEISLKIYFLKNNINPFKIIIL